MDRHRNNPRQPAFTLLEILVVVIILGILGTVSLSIYQGHVKKSEAVEAYLNIGSIRRAEEKVMAVDGNYVAAENAAELNQKLGVAIQPRKYEYSVVNVTEKDFIVIARRLDEDLAQYFSRGIVPAAPVIIAANNAGLMSTGYGPYLPGAGSGAGAGTVRTGGGSSGTPDGGIAGGPDGSAGSAGGSAEISSDGTGGAAGGSDGSGNDTGGGSGGGITGGASGGSTGGSGGSSGSSGGGGSNAPVPDPLTSGGWSSMAPADGAGGLVDEGIQAALDLLKTSVWGSYACDLIYALAIPLTWADLGASTGAVFSVVDGVQSISISSYYSGEPPASLAAFLVHEATHADYYNYSDAWISKTLERHPELTAADIHITQAPHNSIDQEFNAICNQSRVWQELSGDATSDFHNAWLGAYLQGEDFLKDAVRLTYADQGLPEY